MSSRSILAQLLRDEPGDCGCGAGMQLLAAYVELECAGLDPAPRFPTLAAHLRACPACHEDHDALLDDLRASGLA